jgi:hypothetical protein
MSKHSGQEPAFPCEIGFDNNEIQQTHQNRNGTALDNGMSKRFYAACMAMQGILASTSISVIALTDPQKAEYSFIMADNLLKQELL